LIGGYIWSHRLHEQTVEIDVHLYISSTLKIDEDGIDLELKQESDYPWNGDVKFTLRSSKDVDIRLRIPRWASDWKVCKSILLLPSNCPC